MIILGSVIAATAIPPAVEAVGGIAATAVSIFGLNRAWHAVASALRSGGWKQRVAKDFTLPGAPTKELERF